MFAVSSSRSQESYGSYQIVQVNDSVYQLYKPAGIPSIQVVFFHGLQLEPYTDAHLSTWKCEDGSCIWPQKWLVEEMPEAHVFSVSCSGVLRNTLSDSIDMYNLGQNLISDLLMANIGQQSDCPIVLVGHSIGGLVIKELCWQAHHRLHVSRGFERIKLELFLNSIRGVFYYATPHHGSPVADRLADKIGGALLKYFRTLSTDTERLNSNFDSIRKVYEKWQFAGLGEGRPTNLGRFGREVMVVPEASVREDNFNVVEEANHVSICRPRSKTSRSFYKLKGFLTDIVYEMKVAVPIHEWHGLPKYPVGLERCALDVRHKLVGGATLGICGMGGIGKTTLAKQTFNVLSKEFKYTCFVENVKGMQVDKLQDQLLNQVHHNGKKLDTAPTWFHLKDMKTFIVMDDVDSEDQIQVLPKLEHFGIGSCIIMTSRDKEVFKSYENCIIFEVDFLKEDDAKKLFCKHAFGLEHAPDLLIDNVNAVIKKCAGLPLTLEVIGTYLRGRNGEVWMETLQRLSEARAINGGKKDRVWASLRISYDALLKEEQQMFTEAAVVFFGGPLDRALAAWSSVTETMQTTWENLVSRSLVKEINSKVWVHEHLRDLAENISKVILVSGSNATSNSKVDLLNDNKVNAKTKCLRLSYSEGFRKNRTTLQLDSLAKLKRLKYLDLAGVSSEGWGKGVTRKISLVKFEGAQRSTLSKFEFSLNKMDNLAVLELSHFAIPEEFPEALGNLTNLRILWLSHLEGLDRLPENFGNLSRLRQLELRDLRSLTLPKSFGNLLSLDQLTFRSIKSLQLPESLGHVSSLVQLTIARCEELEGLPGSFGHRLTSLRELRIEDCPLIKCLPRRFSRLPGLEKLSILFCRRFEELGEAFGNLSSLRHLDLDHVALDRLPANFSLLSTLQSLRIGTTGHLRSFPDDFGQLTALKELYVSAKGLETLPESFRFPKSLQKVIMRCPTLERMPENLGELALLEALDLDVARVETLPLSVGNFNSLGDLNFSFAVAKRVPESLGQLSSLKSLRLECRHLEKLPDTLGELSSLEQLSISSPSLESLPESLGQLSSIQSLRLWSMKMEKLPDTLVKLSSVEELQFSLPNLESLPECIGGLRNLRKLTLENVKSLKCLPEDFGQLIALQHLTISDADELQTLPDSFSLLKCLQKFTLRSSELERLPYKIGNVSTLEELRIETPSLESLPESTGQLHNLRILTLKKAKKLKSLPEDFGQLIALQDLTISAADELQTLPDSFSLLRCLKKFKLRSCKLERLPDKIGNVSSLEQLRIKAPSLESLPESAAQLHNLKKLALENSKNLKCLPEDFGQLIALQDLEIKADELETLPESFHLLKSLQRLSISCSKLEWLPDNYFGTLCSLEELSIESRSWERLPESVGQLHSLKKLALVAGGNFRSLLDDVGRISSLQEFEFDCDGHEETPNLFGSISLFAHELSLKGRNTRILPPGLGSLSLLRALNLNWLSRLEAIPDELGMLSSLETLTIRGCHMLESLPDSLGQLSSLKDITLRSCKRLKTLPECLGKSSSTHEALQQRNQSYRLRLQAEKSFQAKNQETMRLTILRCPLLDDSRLESLCWIFTSNRNWGRC